MKAVDRNRTYSLNPPFEVHTALRIATYEPTCLAKRLHWAGNPRWMYESRPCLQGRWWGCRILILSAWVLWRSKRPGRVDGRSTHTGIVLLIWSWVTDHPFGCPVCGFAIAHNLCAVVDRRFDTRDWYRRITELSVIMNEPDYQEFLLCRGSFASVRNCPTFEVENAFT